MPVYRIACHAAAAFTLVVLSSAWVAAQQLVVNPALQPPRDRMPPPRTGTAVVKGRVVDGTTGAALARARVSVQGPMRTSVITDAGGDFAIANLPAGPLMLRR